MLVYTDIFSQNELISNSYMPVLKFNDAILMCKSAMIDVNDNVQIGDEEANDESEKVNNILHTFKYKPTQLDKKTFMAWGKQYLKKVMAMLKAGTEE